MTETELDTRGLFCPEPVMMLHNRIRDAAPGDIVVVLASDPSTRRDTLRVCEFLGHALLADEEHDGEFRYRIRKGG